MNHPYRVVLIICVFILAVVSFMLWQNWKTVDDINEATQVPSDEFAEIKFIMDELEAQTGLDLTVPVPSTFTWNVRDEESIHEVVLNGYLTRATGVAEIDTRAVENFFINALFNLDVYNVAAGTISGQSGYLNDNLACVVKTQSIADSLGNLVENSTDITVYCSHLKNEVSDEPVGLANPASVYCQEQGGNFGYVNEEAGQKGYCLLPNGDICDEWAYFNSNGSTCTEPTDPSAVITN